VNFNTLKNKRVYYEFNYKTTYSKQNECDVHLFETDEMVMDVIMDVAEFFRNEELQTEFNFDINFSDDYSVNGFYVTGSDLIDHMKEER